MVKFFFLSGRVDTGHVIIVDHGDNIVSVYKHNSKSLKEQNDFVQAGEVIAYSGNQGSLSSGLIYILSFGKTELL